ncbi:hypothetical protein [Cecembia lonarensis]|uniref:Uncharacterized protein n=1 Tax=Cecembia lonarensis (strain CCUG 58316 / KCTC 22772 / LW9) TaxID=1225176 RepID=K1L8E3_CECL9|nr:hypothetical protein [Cecembia lonarensis]EKB50976.1 hypothetical protein B879_00263 [Cecembia lonarensis LW9]
MPIIRGDITSFNDTDTIFKKEGDYLVPEYLLHLTGFDNTSKLRISNVLMTGSYAFLHVGYDNHSYYVVIDMENNRPLIHLKELFDRELALESVPRQLDRDVFYSILRDEDGFEEKNPMIILYRLSFARN